MIQQQAQQGRSLDNVVDLEHTYGYEAEKEEEKKGGDDWLKLLLNHLQEKKKLYMRPIVPK